MIGIFSDFGANDVYLGQIHATLKKYAPTVPVTDVFNDVPAFNVRAAAHLLRPNTAISRRYRIPERCRPRSR